jgi:hypothetical protein
MDRVEEMRQGILDGDITVIDVRALDADQAQMLHDDRTCAGVAALQAALES